MIAPPPPTDKHRDELARHVAAAAADLEQAKVARDAAITAASHAGLSRRHVAALAGISHTRVQQILDNT